MKIVFVSNYYNHHQSALAQSFYKKSRGQFYFIQTEPMSEERRQLGWGRESLPEFVKKSYLDKEALQECLFLINDADVVIAGSAPNSILKHRLKEKKLIFRYSERIYKNWKNTITLPLRFLKYHTYNYFSKNVYLLCASAYAAKDYAKTLNYINKSFKWGYFPEVKEYEDIDYLINNKEKNSILWVSRFIDWKHPEVPVQIAKQLKAEGYKFQLNMIGNGTLEKDISLMIEKEGLGDCVSLLGSMPPNEVREYMEKSEIFFLTSDKNEGWGAVLNEAMNSACAVISSDMAGAALYLIKNGINGYLYNEGNFKQIIEIIKNLSKDDFLRRSVGKKAYYSMRDMWNADVASERFIVLAQRMLVSENEYNLFNDGPLSYTINKYKK